MIKKKKIKQALDNYGDFFDSELLFFRNSIIGGNSNSNSNSNSINKIAKKIESLEYQLNCNQIFISYCTMDSKLLNEFNACYRDLKPESNVSMKLWNDKMLETNNWEKEIKNTIDDCAMAILFVSKEFFKSNFMKNGLYEISRGYHKM